MFAAPLKSVSFSALANGDSQTASDLLEGCKKEGFVYLDMSGWGEGTSVISTWSQLLDFTKQLFEVPELVKKDFNFLKASDEKNFGFKESGSETGVVEGRKDGFEMFMLPDSILNSEGVLAKEMPDVLKQGVPLIAGYVNTCRNICEVVLDRLSERLGFPESPKLSSHHRDLTQSPSMMSFLKYRAYQPEDLDVGQNAHTDPGSLTLLISTSGGLQVFNSTENQWQFIEPRPNHYIMNVGDCLRFLSRGELSSSLHRVVPHASTKGLERYSIGYFLSPDNDVKLEREREGRSRSSKEWHDLKFERFLAIAAEDAQSARILTGNDQHLPHWNPAELSYVTAKN